MMDERAGEEAFATLGYWFWVTGVSYGVLRISFLTLLGTYAL